MEYNTLFLSDVHLGTRNCQSNKLIEFLKNNKFNKIYLVGDIIDMIMMKRKFYWNKNHNKVIKLLLKLSKNTDITYIIGNHDLYLETLVGEKFGSIKIEETDIHYTKSGEKCMIIHGHQFDGAVMNNFLYKLGSVAYDFSLFLNRMYNTYRKMMNKDYWSLSMYLKSKTKRAIEFINNFEKLVSEYGKKNNVSTIIAGHIHMTKDEVIDGIRYMNCGCWTEFTSCIVEELDGNLNIIDVK